MIKLPKGIEYIDQAWPIQVCVALCVSPKAWDEEMRRLKIVGEPWPESDGRTTTFQNSVSKGRVIIVSLNRFESRTPIEVAGLLIHESVHVWQEIREAMKERTPGAEHEAYTVAFIAQRFLEVFNRMVGARRLAARRG